MQTSGKNSYQKLLYQISNQIFNLMGKLLVKEWDKRLLGLSQLPVKSVIDIGANEGQFARRIIKIFPHAHMALHNRGMN
ncbi:hypothetical protein IQ227_09590 [Anabaena aphanizomenioides LEGE 00250]|uniref:Uncharacterized protein n=1 Tax=Sphaerospermopsis aphanizomenoides LEGE 00250 TaxID=2777972 RepID=A0ABR9VDT1_9CYAN|nr:hypothetical protein [Sphaerospermopsis aphanizomenoides]MBE9236277.1 hypothetical protein [Sphaerospermopsis aphanizomenoides LEGE 00250]